ncbi:hypothetical protein JQS43_08075 [Natronosporangium hydrolyticum]|uniref:DUF3592 domain-containing protein n=1 Tax=Natronosporangium hydrolyticum TaxID=2811111 RepID=A0A895YL65_9ACTN|nr:hypothetical protein [Natronosporangium hydrolyticum]QSB16239.1 hypothetical protein JQS43_08075 [Natronosporangium hydrolyticum]
MAVGASWVLALLVGGAAYQAAENAVDERLERRVTTGTPIVADALAVEKPWLLTTLRATSISAQRATVTYSVDGTEYVTEVLWSETDSVSRLAVGDQVLVYADPEQPMLVATDTGGGSDGFRLIAHHMGVGLWGLVATIACLLALPASKPRRSPPGTALEYRDSTPSMVSTSDGLGKSTSMRPSFAVVLRGYRQAEVDAAVSEAIAAITAEDDTTRLAAAGKLRSLSFPTALRGYDREQVNTTIALLIQQLDSPAGAGGS